MKPDKTFVTENNLTIFVIPHSVEPAKPKGKFENLLEMEEVRAVFYMEEADLKKANDQCMTDWFLYLFEDEYMNAKLKEALPVCMASSSHDLFVFLQKVQHDNGDMKVFQSARMFRKGTQKFDSLLPVDFDANRIERILDGWILYD